MGGEEQGEDAPGEGVVEVVDEAGLACGGGGFVAEAGQAGDLPGGEFPVVAAADSPEGMRTVPADLEDELGGVKLGLTVLTRAECRAGAVTSRLLHVLALIGSGGLIPLWCAPSLALPVPDAATDIDASPHDGNPTGAGWQG
ncbi:hypothetical protein ACFWG6_03640 [Streptomyces erythrochromogenes]|uniref:hypothetical protein n=1 Tax=Streptomyces erythrochromogenes TaxID=285574 RepID=UPI0036451B3A